MLEMKGKLLGLRGTRGANLGTGKLLGSRGTKGANLGTEQELRGKLLGLRGTGRQMRELRGKLLMPNSSPLQYDNLGLQGPLDNLGLQDLFHTKMSFVSYT